MYQSVNAHENTSTPAPILQAVDPARVLIGFLYSHVATVAYRLHPCKNMAQGV